MNLNTTTLLNDSIYAEAKWHGTIGVGSVIYFAFAGPTASQTVYNPYIEIKQHIQAYAAQNNISGMADSNISAPQTNDILSYQAGKWSNQTATSASIMSLNSF